LGDFWRKCDSIGNDWRDISLAGKKRQKWSGLTVRRGLVDEGHKKKLGSAIDSLPSSSDNTNHYYSSTLHLFSIIPSAPNLRPHPPAHHPTLPPFPNTLPQPPPHHPSNPQLPFHPQPRIHPVRLPPNTLHHDSVGL
jgi:hypothetical protein